MRKIEVTKVKEHLIIFKKDLIYFWVKLIFS